MIGLYKAILDHRPEKMVAFHDFAEMCIALTAIKTATRQKHGFINSYISLDRPMYDDDSGRTLLDVEQVDEFVGIHTQGKPRLRLWPTDQRSSPDRPLIGL